MSPAVAPVEVLAKFPPVYINVGSLDPLFDDTIYMARGIAQHNGGRVKLNVYDGLGHGYLNLSNLVPQGREAADHLAQWVIQLLESDGSLSP
jgi:acetyl esterase/lipase